ncbi:MAG: bifunctional UDP-N-acetylmuramoyl-tripeptide:D-alanyl-D-alanine ligase/alanine racemase [Bacteroidetes bacterium]|nr:bifunctional UDP-N-acetylmuramoyl-tripeptide:D-alanyl-D-alanine ligase/alanine racemase [Bacteroidota bacterium]
MYSSAQIAAIINASHSGESIDGIRHLVIDSRNIISTHSSLFFAINGQRHDGHKFIAALYEKGVRCFVVEQLPENASTYPEACFLNVKDSVGALQQLASYHRKQFNIPVIGITGSNGKTIVKEWLYQLMREDKNIVRSPKSYNSQVGVPISVWQLNKEHELGIFEAGISMPGEMEKLEKIIQPTIGLITNIGQAHDESFSDHTLKMQEKLKLFKNCSSLIYCKDHSGIHKQIQTAKQKNTFSWSIKTGADLIITGIKRKPHDTSIEGLFKKKTIEIEIPFTDDASIENAINCWATLLHLNYSSALISQRMQLLSPVAMRLEMKEGINNCSIINDSYNSDLGSLNIALDFLNQHKQHIKKTVILSDILQSGKNEERLYKEVAHLLETKGIYRLIGIGKAIERQSKLFTINKHFYDSTEDLLKHHGDIGFHDEAILIKGARTFGFERISKLLQRKAHETVMEINLNAVVHNLNYFRSKLKPGTKLMAMVKASSYGSGSYEIANVLQFHHVDYLAVAYADEGVELRKAGITLPIMVMNPEEQGYDAMIEYGLEPEIFSMRIIRLFNEALKRNVALTRSDKPAAIHIKLDTGMHRLGFEENTLDELIAFLKENKTIHVRSIFSHLSSADEAKHDDFTKEQISRFEKMQKKIAASLNYPVLSHMLNSAGISRFPQAQFDMVRLGIGLYGIGCNAEEQKQLEFVNTLKTTISQIKDIKAGESIGYNRKFFAKKDMRIATVPIGYADGLNRRLSNGKGKMIVNGQPAPIVGNVCMDMCMLDITGIPANESDEVIVFGKEYPVTQFANDAETIPYEVLTSMSRRVKRVYYQE